MFNSNYVYRHSCLIYYSYKSINEKHVLFSFYVLWFFNDIITTKIINCRGLFFSPVLLTQTRVSARAIATFLTVKLLP